MRKYRGITIVLLLAVIGAAYSTIHAVAGNRINIPFVINNTTAGTNPYPVETPTQIRIDNIPASQLYSAILNFGVPSNLVQGFVDKELARRNSNGTVTQAYPGPAPEAEPELLRSFGTGCALGWGCVIAWNGTGAMTARWFDAQWFSNTAFAPPIICPLGASCDIMSRIGATNNRTMLFQRHWTQVDLVANPGFPVPIFVQCFLDT